MSDLDRLLGKAIETRVVVKALRDIADLVANGELVVMDYRVMTYEAIGRGEVTLRVQIPEVDDE